MENKPYVIEVKIDFIIKKGKGLMYDTKQRKYLTLYFLDWTKYAPNIP